MSLLDAVIQEADKVTMEDIKSTRRELLAKISDYSMRLQVFSWGLHNYFVELYVTFDLSRSLEQMNYSKLRDRANIDFSDLQEEVRIFKDKFGDDTEVNNAFKSLESVFKYYVDMSTIINCIQTIGEASKDYDIGNYTNAVLALRKVQKNLEFECDKNLNEAMDNLITHVELSLSLSYAQMSLDWSNIIKWSYRLGAVSLYYSISVQQDDLLLIQKVLKTMYATQRLNVALQGFSDFFIKNLVTKLVEHNCEIYTEDHVGALVFNVQINLRDINVPPLSTVLDNLTAVFDFLETTVGCKMTGEDKRFMEVFGDSNRTSFCDIIINRCIKQHLPVCDESMAAYKALVVELDNFNKFLGKLKYLDEYKSPFLYYINYISMFDNSYVKFLADSRELMKVYLTRGFKQAGTVSEGKVSDSSTVDVTETAHRYDFNAPLFFPRCKITENIKVITTYITRELERSMRHPSYLVEYYAIAIRAVAIMYGSLIPERHKHDLEHNPLSVALFFNNCHFLAHTLLGPPWKKVMSKKRADILTSVVMDQVIDLRVIGMEKLSAYLEKFRDAIEKKFDEIVLPWTNDSYYAFDLTVNYILENLRQLSETWSDVLPRTMYVNGMCTLANTMCEMMIQTLFLDPSPISQDIVPLVAMNFQDCIDVISVLFMMVVGLETKMKDWARFKLIPRLLGSHLHELATLWTGAPEVKQNFTCEEIRQIIKMRFANNESRLNVLVEIQ